MLTKSTDRFIDSVNGSNSNSGLLSSPWKTLSMLTNVPAGGTAFLIGGSIFDEMISNNVADDVIIDGISYSKDGKTRAKINGSALNNIMSGVYNNISIVGVQFSNSIQRHVNIWAGSSNINFSNCLFDINGTGAPNDSALYARGCWDISITDCVFTQDGYGDKIYLDQCTGNIFIIDCDISTPQGPAADNIQISGAADFTKANILISGNRISMRDVVTNSGKGNIVITKMYGKIIIENNDLIGLNYCCSLASNDVIARNNNCSEANLNSYSWALGVGEAYNLSDHQYLDNTIDNCKRGICFSAQPKTYPSYIDCVSKGNIINNCFQALRIDRPVSGEFTYNNINHCATAYSITNNTIPQGGQYTTFDHTTGNVIKS